MISALSAAGYRPVAKEVLFVRGWSNEVSFDRALKNAAITVYPSPGGDYALNVKAPLDIVDQIKKGVLDGGKLFLADRQRGRAIFSINLLEMVARFEGKLARDGDRGPYFWINARGYPVEEVETLSDVPFPDTSDPPM